MVVNILILRERGATDYDRARASRTRLHASVENDVAQGRRGVSGQQHGRQILPRRERDFKRGSTEMTLTYEFGNDEFEFEIDERDIPADMTDDELEDYFRADAYEEYKDARLLAVNPDRYYGVSRWD